MIAKYPELVNVIVRMSSSRGVSLCGSKHALELTVVFRKCITKRPRKLSARVTCDTNKVLVE